MNRHMPGSYSRNGGLAKTDSVILEKKLPDILTAGIRAPGMDGLISLITGDTG